MLVTIDPQTTTNPVGTNHMVTATIADPSDTNQNVGIPVEFTVLSGPNQGTTGTCTVNANCTTDANGQVSWTYTGGNITGTDVIQACYPEAIGTDIKVCSQLVNKVWNADTGSGPVIDIDLAPPSDLNLNGQDHSVTASVTSNGEDLPGALITFNVLFGPNQGTTGICSVNPNCTTDESGQVSWQYTGDSGTGTDQIQACYEIVDVGTICSEVVEKEWTEEVIDLTPLSATNPIETDHTITALLTDAKSNPLPGIEVTFTVISGPNVGTSQAITTNANGEAQFTYTGDGGEGEDSIEACFTNAAGQPKCSDLAFKEWIVKPIPVFPKRGETTAVPSLNQWGLIAVILILMISGCWALKRRKKL